jgi:hypothetical protein
VSFVKHKKLETTREKRRRMFIDKTEMQARLTPCRVAPVAEEEQQECE